jgi:hypothetical protein
MGIQKSGDLAIIHKRDLATSGYPKNKENEKKLGILFILLHVGEPLELIR